MMTDDDLSRIRDHAESNPSHAGDVTLRLVAEVERCRAEKQELVWRLEELMDRWGERRNEMVGVSGCNFDVTDAMWTCVEELEAAIPEPQPEETGEATPDHLEPPTFGWTKRGAKVRAAVREFNKGLEGGRDEHREDAGDGP